MNTKKRPRGVPEYIPTHEEFRVALRAYSGALAYATTRMLKRLHDADGPPLIPAEELGQEMRDALLVGAAACGAGLDQQDVQGAVKRVMAWEEAASRYQQRRGLADREHDGGELP